MGRLLVIDADGDLAAALGRIVGAERVRVERAATPAQALAAARVAPAAFFVRTRPGEVGAAGLVSRLRRAQPAVPVIVVAREPAPQEELVLRREGILCYLQEPVADAVLREVVAAATPYCHDSWFRAGTVSGRDRGAPVPLREDTR